MSLLRIINTYSKSARLFQYNSDRLRILLLFLYVFLRSFKLGGGVWGDNDLNYKIQWQNEVTKTQPSTRLSSLCICLTLRS